MKPIMILALAGAALYIYSKSKSASASTLYPNDTPTSGSNLTPYGPPVYSGTPAANTPGQINAYLTYNAQSTVAGGGQYVPAFGPNENQPTTDLGAF
jgi:hypothetical protein